MKSNKNSLLIGYSCLIITSILFSSFEVVSKTLIHKIHPMQMTFLRFFIGGIVLLPFAVFSKSKKSLNLNILMKISALGILNILISMTLLQLTVKHATATIAATLISSTPIFVAFFSIFIFKEKLTAKTILFLMLSFFGVSLISLSKLGNGISLLGIILGILSAITFAFFTIFSKFIIHEIGSLKFTAYNSFIGAICYIPILLHQNKPIFHFPIEYLWQVLFLGVFVSGIAYITFMKAIEILNPGKGSYVFFLKPIIASILAVLFLNEYIHPLQILGILFIILSIYNLTIRPKIK